jgi:hypothetical protein
LTDNYLPVELTEPLPSNQLVEVQISGTNVLGALVGTVEIGVTAQAVESEYAIPG